MVFVEKLKELLDSLGFCFEERGNNLKMDLKDNGIWFAELKQVVLSCGLRISKPSGEDRFILIEAGACKNPLHVATVVDEKTILFHEPRGEKENRAIELMRCLARGRK